MWENNQIYCFTFVVWWLLHAQRDSLANELLRTGCSHRELANTDPSCSFAIACIFAIKFHSWLRNTCQFVCRLSPGGPLQLYHQSHFMDFSLCYSTLGKRVQDVNWRQHSCMNLLTGELPPFVRTVHFDTWPLGIAMCFSFKKFGCGLEYSLEFSCSVIRYVLGLFLMFGLKLKWIWVSALHIFISVNHRTAAILTTNVLVCVLEL